MTECRNLVTHSDDVHAQLVQATKAGMEWHEELQAQAQQQGLKGKKFAIFSLREKRKRDG